MTMNEGRSFPSSSATFPFIIFLLSVIHNGVLHVHADSHHTMRIPLIHKYSDQFQGGTNVINKTETDIMRELHHEDQIRHQMISEIPRRKNAETKPALALPMLSGYFMRSGLYWVEVKIGTPPQQFLLAADTGSDLTWVNCKADGAHHQSIQKVSTGKKETPKKVFRADQSSSFKAVPCDHEMCRRSLSHMHANRDCPTPTSPCRYNYSYMSGDASGFFGHDTITVPSRLLPNMTIGCTEYTSKFKDQGDGILGLGFGAHSFSETVVNSKYAGKFSYCLMNHRKNESALSYLTFGPNNQTVKRNMSHTQLLMMNQKGVLTDFYGVNVSGISLGGTYLNIPHQVWVEWSGRGGAVLDSGTTNTFLPTVIYRILMEELTKHFIQFDSFTLPGLPFDFCFNDKGFNESTLPRLAFHFADGVVFRPPVRNYVTTLERGTRCLGFVRQDNEEFIIGNQMMQNHLWEFDVEHETLGFAISTCLSN